MVIAISILIAFFGGMFSMFYLGNFVSSGYKDENLKLQTLNESLSIENYQLKNKLKNGNNSNSNTSYSVPQFTQEDLKILRNLSHPDKHKNSQNANDMFVKINHLIK